MIIIIINEIKKYDETCYRQKYSFIFEKDYINKHNIKIKPKEQKKNYNNYTEINVFYKNKKKSWLNLFSEYSSL